MTNHRDFDPKTYTRRNSNRLPFYDYRSTGTYFVTICTYKRQRVLEIPTISAALHERWHHLPQRFTGVQLDEFVIMPDHVHSLLSLNGDKTDRPTLGKVIGTWKAWVTIAWRTYHKDAHIPCLSHLWQKDFYEHVIRNEEDLQLTREYILNNPLKALMIQEQRYKESKTARRNSNQP